MTVKPEGLDLRVELRQAQENGISFDLGKNRELSVWNGATNVTREAGVIKLNLESGGSLLHVSSAPLTGPVVSVQTPNVIWRFHNATILLKLNSAGEVGYLFRGRASVRTRGFRPWFLQRWKRLDESTKAVYSKTNTMIECKNIQRTETKSPDSNIQC